jgi:hypothetical protein
MKTSLKVLGQIFFLTTASLFFHASVSGGNFNTGNCYPLMCDDSGTNVGQSIHYQQVYTATAFTGTTLIDNSWYYDNMTGGRSILLGGTYVK